MDWDDNREYWLDVDSSGIKDAGETTIEGNDYPIKHLRGSGNVYYEVNDELELTG